MNAMQPPQSVEEIKAGLETTEKGGVRQSIRNCLTVFQRDPLLSGAIAYNILTDRKDIIKPIGFHRESTALNDTVLWSSIFVTLMANKIGGLQFGIYRNCQISSRVFHTAVAALPLTKANRSDFE